MNDFSVRVRNRKENIFCSRKCYGQSLVGKPAPWVLSDKKDEIGAKISITKTGVKVPAISKALIGRRHSKETKEKMRQAKLKNPVRYWLGKKRPEVAIFLGMAQKGKSLSEKHKMKLSRALKGRKMTLETRKKMSLARRGAGSSNWKGGISNKNKRIRAGMDFSIWRNGVFKRDDYTCRKCKTRGTTLHPHHIFSFAQYEDLRFEVANGITFCEGCHLIFHKTYGFGNNNHHDIIKYIKV